MPDLDFEKENVQFVFQSFKEKVPEDADFVVAGIATGDVVLSEDDVNNYFEKARSLAAGMKKDLWLVYPADQILIKEKREAAEAGAAWVYTMPVEFYAPLFWISPGKYTRRSILKIGAVALLIAASGVSGCITEDEAKALQKELDPLMLELSPIVHAIAAKKLWTSIIQYYFLKGSNKLKVCVLCVEEKQAKAFKKYLVFTKEAEKKIIDGKETLDRLDEIYKKLAIVMDRKEYKEIKIAETLKWFVLITPEKDVKVYNINVTDGWDQVKETEIKFWKKKLGK